MTTVQTGTSSSALSIGARNVIQLRAGNAYDEGYQEDTSWKELIELISIQQEETTYLADLSSHLARRWLGGYQFDSSKIAKHTLKVYPFYAAKSVKDDVIAFNLIPSLSSLAEDVARAMGQLMSRWVYNSYAAGNAIECIDAVPTKYVFDDDHGGLATGGDNLRAEAFTEGAVESAMDQMAGLMDHTGKKQIGTVPTVILLNPARTTLALKQFGTTPLIVTGLSATDAVATRTNMSIFQGIRPMFSAEINTNQFILVNTKGKKKPFIFNDPLGGKSQGVIGKIVINQQEQDTDDWLISLKKYYGMMATEVWYKTLGSGAEGGFPDPLNPATNLCDI